MNLPESFTNRIKTQLGDEYEAYMNCLDQGMHHGLRVNTNKISVEDFLKISPFELKPVPWTTNGFYYDDKACTPSKHPYYYAGLYYIQEPSAMAPASILPVEDGDVVLDICAAPGGKSTELAAKLHGTGFLISNDISNSRAKALLKNLELFGIGNMCVVSEAPNKLSTKFYQTFDKILIDAAIILHISQALHFRSFPMPDFHCKSPDTSELRLILMYHPVIKDIRLTVHFLPEKTYRSNTAWFRPALTFLQLHLKFLAVNRQITQRHCSPTLLPLTGLVPWRDQEEPV